MQLFNYMQDGAGNPARIVLAYLQSLEETIVDIFPVNQPRIVRFSNDIDLGQGYIVSLLGVSEDKQINISFAEDRDSNNNGILVTSWQDRANIAPTMWIPTGRIFKKKSFDKYDVAAKYITDILIAYATKS